MNILNPHTASSGQPAVAYQEKKLRALVVDDHMLMRRIVSDHMKKLGFADTEQAIHGEEAWSKIQAGNFDVVLLDWSMPVMDGFSFLQKCRADSRFDNVAVVMLTAECEQHNVLNALQAGANSYIVKPVSFDILAQKMQNVVEWIERKRNG
ncbi:MAG: response regulator [Rickettsiales bacterium]